MPLEFSRGHVGGMHGGAAHPGAGSGRCIPGAGCPSFQGLIFLKCDAVACQRQEHRHQASTTWAYCVIPGNWCKVLNEFVSTGKGIKMIETECSRVTVFKLGVCHACPDQLFGNFAIIRFLFFMFLAFEAYSLVVIDRQDSLFVRSQLLLASRAMCVTAIHPFLPYVCHDVPPVYS